jgi:ABC-type glycerol-3-phosphate transport system permease component
MNIEKKRIIPKVFFLVLIVFLILWSIFPLLYAIVFSFSGPVLPTEFFIPKQFSIEAYKIVLFEDPIWRYLKNSFFVAVIACLITIPLSTLAGYGFSRTNNKRLNIFFYLFIMFRMLPWVTPILPTFSLVEKMKLIDTHIGLGLIHSLWIIPLSIWLMKGYFDMVPKEIEEAAFMDGAGYFGTFFRIALPLARIGIVVTVLFVFLYSYIEFMYALSLTRINAVTLPIKLASYSTEGRMYWREMSAASLISTIPMIVLFIFLQKHIARGLTFGALKE